VVQVTATLARAPVYVLPPGEYNGIIAEPKVSQSFSRNVDKLQKVNECR